MLLRFWRRGLRLIEFSFVVFGGVLVVYGLLSIEVRGVHIISLCAVSRHINRDMIRHIDVDR